MTYQTYADHHITPRDELPDDWCPTTCRPKHHCNCRECCVSRYPADGVESDGGEQ